MKYFAIYHPETGQILGRIWVTEDKQAELYPNRIEVKRREWRAPLEKLQVVDVKTKERVNMTEAEARIHGATDRDIQRGRRRRIIP